ncbi:MAG: NnrS family protein [Thermoplasmataceae archaeon]
MPGSKLNIYPSRERSRSVVLFLLAVASTLVAGLLIGISKLSAQNGFYLDSNLAAQIGLHPFLMVYGAIGGLLLAEKLEMMNSFKVARSLSISMLIIPSFIGGIAIFSVGFITSIAFLKFTGAVLVTISALLFMWFMVSRKIGGNNDAKFIMGAALLAFALSPVEETLHSATESPGVALLMLSFPIIYVLGERIELGQMRGIPGIWIGLMKILSVLGPVSLFIGNLVYRGIVENMLIDAGLASLSGMALISLYHDPAIRISKVNRKLQSYMRLGIRSSYAWLILGIILYALQVNVSRGFMDAATHSIALGFLGSFIISHSPVIFPLILKIRVDTEKVTKLPLYAMNASVLLRVVGDIARRVAYGYGVISFVSEWVLIIAIVLFLANIIKIRVNTAGLPWWGTESR